MIVSKFGKSYDTSDGSEQAHARSVAATPGSSARAADRWADDGGPSAAQPTFVPLEKKPGWSVLSLRELNLAIERQVRADAAARERDEADAPERERLLTQQAGWARREAADQQRADRYRNAWEHT